MIHVQDFEFSLRSASRFYFSTVAGALLLLSQTSSNAGALLWQGGASSSWDIGLSTDWLDGGSLSVYADGEAVTFDDSAISYSPQVAAIVQPSSITVNATNNYTFGGTGAIAGATGLFKTGTGVLTLGNANTFSNSIVVDNGILRYANSNSLAPLSGGVLYATNNGSLDVIGGATGTNKVIAVSGTGYLGQGVIMTSPNSGGVNTIVGSVSMLGDTTIGCINGSRWDTAVGGIFNGNGFKLTKVGGGSIFLYRCNNTGLGDVEVTAGSMGFYYPLDLGNPASTVTVDAGATLDLYGGFPGLNKNFVLTNSTLYNAYVSTTTTGTNILLGPITLIGTNNVINTFATMILSNGLVGTGGFAKAGANTLYLYGANTYAGPTFIEAGEIVLGANATLGTNLINFSAGANLDVSANASGLNLVNGQSLIAGNGSTIVGSLNANSGSTLSVGGTGPGILNVNQLSLSGATVQVVLGSDPTDTTGAVNSLIIDNGSLALSGVNTIEIGAWGELQSGTPYIVAQYNGTLTGGLANLQVVSENPSYTFTVVDPATTPGNIEIMVNGTPQPKIWVGGAAGAPTAWDTSTTNWFNTVTSLPGVFYNGDPVTFDDTAVTNEVTVTGATAAAVTFNNNSYNYVLDGGGTLGGTLELDGSANVTLAMTNLPTLSLLNLNAGTLVLDSPAVGGKFTIAAPISGSGTLALAGSNTVILANTNIYTYNGVIIVTNGVLQCSTSNSLALGSTPVPLYVTNGGTFDLVGGGGGSGVKDLEVAGAGYNGQGALNYSSTSTANQTLTKYIDLVGDTTIGSAGRWNASGTFNGNGFNVTKVGSGQFWLYSLSGDTGIGDIDVQGGEFAIYGSGSFKLLGDPTKTITVESGATVLVYQKATANKNLVLNGGGTLSSSFSAAGAANFNFWIGQITLNGTNTIATTTNLWISNSISGTGGFTKTGVDTLGLVGTACTYTGPTFISAGTVAIGTNVSLASSLISVAAGTKLDITQPATFTLGAGQMLGGAGTVTGGNLVFGSGSTLETSLSDSTVATLTASGHLSFQAGSSTRVVVNKGTTLTNNKVTGAAGVTFGGTLAIVKIGATALADGDAIPLFSAASYSGSFAAITPATPGSGLAWNTNTLATDGTLRVVSGGVDTTPINITGTVINGQLNILWPTNHLGWTLQAQTNGPGQGIGTNWVNVANSATNTQMTLPIDKAAGSVFYRLVYP
jgi:autotransporter-associated beta strand protein